MIKETLFILLGLLVTIFPLSSSKAQTEHNKRDLITQLDSISKKHASHPSLAGVSVAVVHKDSTLLHKGYGKADLELNVSTSRNSIYEVGSVTKQFTAAAILHLVSKDSIQLDNNITEYLPSYNTRGHTITIRHLLYHTSGIQPYLSLPHAPHVMSEPLFSADPVPRDSILSLVGKFPLRFAPGTAMSYSNTGYFILGVIIEKVSGLSFKEYVESNLLEPLNMNNSYICSDKAINKQEAKGYFWFEGKGIQNRPINLLKPKWEIGMSGLCSTSGDLVRWTKALHTSEVLPDSLYNKMITPGHLLDGTELRYAMGIGYRKANGHKSLQHSGSTAGFMSNLRYYPSSDLTIAVLQNTRGIPKATNIPKTDVALGDTLAYTILGEGERVQINPYKDDLSPFTGLYSGPAATGVRTLEVQEEDGQLIISSFGSNKNTQLIRISGLTWRPDNESSEDRYIFIQKENEVPELRIDRVHEHLVLHRID